MENGHANGRMRRLSGLVVGCYCSRLRGTLVIFISQEIAASCVWLSRNSPAMCVGAHVKIRKKPS